MADMKAGRVLARTLARELDAREISATSGGQDDPLMNRCAEPYCESGVVNGEIICDPPDDF